MEVKELDRRLLGYTGLYPFVFIGSNIHRQAETLNVMFND
jgi:hypothetical protein